MKEMRDLMNELRDFPRLIHDAERKAEELREIWTLDRVKRDYAFAESFLRSKLKGMPETQAKQVALQDVFEHDKLLVLAESKFRKAMADYTYLENQFQAARKVANLQETALNKLGVFE